LPRLSSGSSTRISKAFVRSRKHLDQPSTVSAACGAPELGAAGRHLQVRGTAHNRVLVSICQLMSLADVQSFGTTGQGFGGLAGLG
jgi:hypothetical protein